MKTRGSYLVRFGICVGILIHVSGCSGGIALFIAAAIEDDDSRDGRVDAPPTVAYVGVPAFVDGHPDCIQIRFRVGNDDQGHLSARVEVVPLAVDPEFNLKTDQDGEPIPFGPRGDAVPLPGSGPPASLNKDEIFTFLWDVKQSLGDDSAMVQLLVTPVEDGRDGAAAPSIPFRVGNTEVKIQNLQLSSNASVLSARFDLVDRESDRVGCNQQTMKIALSIAGEAFVTIPLLPELVDRVGQEFLSTPGTGAQGSFNLDLGALGEIPDIPTSLLELAQPGFAGDVSVEVSVTDWPDEDWSADRTSFFFDNNEAPWAAILPHDAGISNGIVPIRYRIFDPDQEPDAPNGKLLGVDVAVRLGDDEEFMSALEFPSVITDGVDELLPLSTDRQGDSWAPFHTFLWDISSQWQGETHAEIAITPRDRQNGIRAVLSVSPISLGPFNARQPLIVAPNAQPGRPADYDGDGYADLLAAGQGTAWFFRGGPMGLQFEREFSVASSGLTWIDGNWGIDINGDSIPDAIVIAGMYFTVFLGGEGGIVDEQGRRLVFQHTATVNDVVGGGLQRG